MAERGIIFKDTFVNTPNRSWFDLSYDFLFSFNFGELVPTTFMECMAEDIIHAKSDNFTRLSPLVAPAFGRVNMFSYHFYVRNKDIWTHWRDFFTNQDQRESWQKQIRNNFAFISPSMPYLDVRKILYNSKLFVDYDASGHQEVEFDTTGHDGVLDFYINGYPLDQKRYLMLGVGMYNERLVAYITQDPTFIDTNEETYLWICIPFVPNKDERNTYNENVIHYYNPFSNGSLFDYLGLDLSGVYYDQLDWINDIYTASKTYYGNGTYYPGSVFSRSTIFDPYQYDIHLTDDEIKSIEPVSINIGDWLCSHAILGAFVLYNNENKRVYGVNTLGNLVTYVKSDDTYVNQYTDNQFRPLYFDDESSKISNLPIRAYYFIYSEYFRDQNYIDINDNVDFTRDGEDIDWSLDSDIIFDFLTIKLKAWEHDCYTSALPGPQRGKTVRYLPDAKFKVSNSTIPSGDTFQVARFGTSGEFSGILYGASSSDTTVNSNYSTKSLSVDLSAATIENLRFANATQRYLEKVARSGGRYYEYMKAIFGADISDEKLDRPIFLQGDKTPVQVSEVLQTSATQLNDDQPLGQMAGRAVAVGSDDYLEYVTPDNGFFVELCAVLPRVSYQQGIAEMFTRKVQLDYPLPDYANLGEEQVKQSSLWYSAKGDDDNIPFGYQSRYWSWKYNRDRIAGKFKDSLNHWTWARIFDDAPVNGRKFIEVHPDYRQFAVTSELEEHVYTNMFHDIQVERALPVFGIPQL